MKKLSKADLLHVYMYRDIYENSYDIKHPDVIPPGKLLFCEACNLRDFFETLSHYPERKIVLLSCESDCGVVYQNEFPSNADIFKAYWRIDWNDVAKTDHYCQIVMKGCQPDKCVFTDKFAAKIDGLTYCTFNEIPNNVVAWFCTNGNIDEDRVHFLPLGINSYGLGKDILFDTPKSETRKLFYVNFEANTYERYNYKNYFKNKQYEFNEWMSYIETPKPVNEFFQEMASHDIICCPFGTGFQTYRTYESMYLDSIPLIQPHRIAAHMANLGMPIGITGHYYISRPDELKQFCLQFNTNKHQFNYDTLTKNYWFNKIQEAVKLI